MTSGKRICKFYVNNKKQTAKIEHGLTNNIY